MKEKKFDLVCLGELLMDMFSGRVVINSEEANIFIPKPGGAPANVAVAARRLGLNSGFIGKVGVDYFGNFLAEVMEEEGVDTGGLCFDPDVRTTMAVIFSTGKESQDFTFYRNPGADQTLSKNDLNLDMLRSTKILHVGSLSLSDEPARTATFEAVDIASNAGAMISYDVNYRPDVWEDASQALTLIRKMLNRVNLVKVNEVEAALLVDQAVIDPNDLGSVEDTALQLLELGPDCIVITFGSSGSYFQTNEGGKFVPPYRIEAVDMVGCGDAFVAGLLKRFSLADVWVNELSPENMIENLLFANAVGALTSMNVGAIPSMPYLEDVNKFMEKHNRENL